MTTIFTTNAIVLDRLGNGNTSLTTAEIDEIINQHEAEIITRLKIPSTFTFDAATRSHQVLRLYVTAASALSVLAATPLSWHGLEYLHTTMNQLKDEKYAARDLLDDQDFFNFIEAQ